MTVSGLVRSHSQAPVPLSTGTMTYFVRAQLLTKITAASIAASIRNSTTVRMSICFVTLSRHAQPKDWLTVKVPWIRRAGNRK